MVKTLLNNLLVLIVLLVGVEMVGQLVFLVKNKDFLFNDSGIQRRHRLFKLHSNLSVSIAKNFNETFEHDKQYQKIRTTEFGTRWTGADLMDTSKIRIACMGGSTTFCTGVGDENTWPALLQKKLGNKYAVINFGVPSYKTVESIIQLALYVYEFKPDVIVFYQGVNDMYNYYMQPNYPDYKYHSEILMPLALLGTKKFESGFDKFKRKSGFFYVVHNIQDMIYKTEIPEKYNVPDEVVDKLFRRI